MIWLALVVALLLWWLMTGLALMSVHQPRALKQPIFLLVTIIAAIAVWGVEANAAQHTTVATVTGFAMGLVIWAWLELSYLMGYITGPVKRPATDDMTWQQRFYNALGTTIYHELLVLGAVGIVCMLGAGLPNPTIQNTLAVLWLMRWSSPTTCDISPLICARVKTVGLSFFRRRSPPIAPTYCFLTVTSPLSRRRRYHYF